MGDFQECWHLAEQVNWKLIREKAGPFPPQAYQFVRDGLAHTARMVHGDYAENAGNDQSRHVSGQQLCLGLRDHAIRQYGAMARTVLESWHIRSTLDFGRIVFAMIDAGMMRKTDEDDLADFDNVFEFDEAFADLTPA
ncbi:MAG: Minf_1886 family protein [Phycisphaerae bacterium]|jgi:uncharacterized repeat protein (TIGR04138 family)